MKAAIDSDFENVIYSNNHVTISSTLVQVGQQTFPSNNISSKRLIINTPNRKPSLTLIALGALVTLVAQLNFTPHYLIYNLQFGSYTFSQTDLITVSGISLSVIGLLTIAVMPNSYTIQINSGGMNINLLTSRRKGYVKVVSSSIEMMLRHSTKQMQNTQASSTQFPG